jgi:hypothetical protein
MLFKDEFEVDTDVVVPTTNPAAEMADSAAVLDRSERSGTVVIPLDAKNPKEPNI